MLPGPQSDSTRKKDEGPDRSGPSLEFSNQPWRPRSQRAPDALDSGHVNGRHGRAARRKALPAPIGIVAGVEVAAWVQGPAIEEAV